MYVALKRLITSTEYQLCANIWTSVCSFVFFGVLLQLSVLLFNSFLQLRDFGNKVTMSL